MVADSPRRKTHCYNYKTAIKPILKFTSGCPMTIVTNIFHGSQMLRNRPLFKTTPHFFF